MNVRKNARLLALAALLLAAVQPMAYAGPNLPCWMQQIQGGDEKIYIWFLPEYRGSAHVSTKAQERHHKTSSNATSEYLVMREGEAAFASDGLHSGCEITVERRGGQVGLRVKTYVNLPHLPYDERTEFIPATTLGGSQSQR